MTAGATEATEARTGRQPLAELDGRRFDVAVIGAGVNGASAAQHLAGAGYTVLLVDKGDFGGGSSSRSSRLLHCGLRYLAPGASMWEFVRQPRKLQIAVTMARAAMLCRQQFVNTTPERARAMRLHFPVYRDGSYARWQIELAFRLLAWLGGRGGTPLDYRFLSPAEAVEMPLVEWLREPERLAGVAGFREYQFDWPERVVVDTVLDAERLGAVARNYTGLASLQRQGGRWRLGLEDVLVPEERASVEAALVVNTAGIWIDAVNACAKPGGRRLIQGTKGVHVMVQLPEACRDLGIATINRAGEPFYCIPWRGLHYFGPTETLYDGDFDDVRPSEEEIAWIVDEANFLLPALALRRQDVLFAWAGVRPLGNDPAFPKGKRSREVHDLGKDGLPNLLAMTAGPVMTHRSAGPELTWAVADRLEPSGERQTPSYAARRFPENQNSPPLLEHWPEIKLADVAHAARDEHVTNLVDLMFRRLGAGWTRSMGAEAAETAARAAAEVLGWGEARIAQEVAHYRAYLAEQHAVGRD